MLNDSAVLLMLLLILTVVKGGSFLNVQCLFYREGRDFFCKLDLPKNTLTDGTVIHFDKELCLMFSLHISSV